MNFIRENGGVLTVLAAVTALLLGYAEWRISVAVDAKFVEAGSVAPHRMDQAEEDIDKLETQDDRFDDKIDRIIEILLEE